jgi:hypothetical protein
MKTEAQIRIGGATAWAALANKRLTGYPWNYMGFLCAGLLAGILAFTLALVITKTLSLNWILFFLIQILLVGALLMLFARFVQNLSVLWYRRQLLARGTPDPLPLALELVGDSVRWQIGDIQSTAPISEVSEVLPVGPYWVLLIQGTAIYMPRRAFGDSQRAFLSELLSQMPEAAKARSPEAARIANA